MNLTEKCLNFSYYLHSASCVQNYETLESDLGGNYLLTLFSQTVTDTHLSNVYSAQRCLGMGICGKFIHQNLRLGSYGQSLILFGGRKPLMLTEKCLNVSYYLHSVSCVQNQETSESDLGGNYLLTLFSQTVTDTHLSNVYSAQRCLGMGMCGKSSHQNLRLGSYGQSLILVGQHHRRTLEFGIFIEIFHSTVSIIPIVFVLTRCLYSR